MDKRIISNIKTLGIDAIAKAKSGHSGIVLGAANILYILYKNHMKINAEDPNWINRDRFVMSAGHGSALLYATLYMAGFDIYLDDLKKFRQIGSITPGHPEYTVTPGVDVSTGPLGQGIANAVGLAIGEKKLHDLNDKIDYNVYALCGDGDLMEGISYEAASLAGTLNLDNLILLYDSNNISLDGKTSMTFTENVLGRFKSQGWDTFEVENNIEDIDEAINKAKKCKKPSIIKVNTIIGEGSMLENSNKVHGVPLKEEDIKALKKKLDIDDKDFYVDLEAKDYFSSYIRDRNIDSYDNIKISDTKVNILDYEIETEEYEATRVTNGKIMNIISSLDPLFVGGSADLASSTKTYLNEPDITSNDFSGKNIWFGVREHSMGAICNGLALSKFKPFCSTFLVFSDYLKPAMRMSSLMDLPVTYIFSHDSINVGEDGPTHQPIEQLSTIRSIPNMTLYRPCDANELLGCWNEIIKNKKPSTLIVSKKEVKKLSNSNSSLVSRGAYIIKPEKNKLDAIIIATGTEVYTALDVANMLEQDNYNIRVISMPSKELFMNQNEEYRISLLPNVKTFVIEAGSSFGWGTFVKSENHLIALSDFGVSGKSSDVIKHMNFDTESIYEKIKEEL